MHRVAVLAFDDVVAFDLATPPQVFGSLTPPRYETRVCAATPAVTAAQGFTIGAQEGLDWLMRAGTVIVPGIGGRRSEVAPDTLEALRRASAGGARIASICTGALVLAAAGLLDGRRVTTHWGYVDDLRGAAPTATVEPDVLWVDEGDLVTSAGVAAGIDLCLHLVRRDHGAAVANQAARRMVVAPQRAGGQAQFIDRPVPEAAGGLQATREWLLERLDQPLTVEEMARHAGYSSRTFARRFRAETGTTPLQWLLAQRVLAARRLLEQTDDPVEHVAARCGFGTATALREHFRRACATTPTAYRTAFSATARATSTSVRVAKPEPPLAA